MRHSAAYRPPWGRHHSAQIDAGACSNLPSCCRTSTTCAAYALVVLPERGVDGERGRDHEGTQRLIQRPVNLHDVIVALRKPLLGQPRPRLGDPGDLVSGRVLDVEVPRIPVFADDRAQRSTTGLEAEADLANDAEVLLHDLTDLSTAGVAHDHLGPDELRWPGQRDQHTAIQVDDLQPDRPVWVGQHRHRLLHDALADFPDRADLLAMLVIDGVFGVDLNEFGLLVDDQHRFGEERSAADLSTGGGTGHAHLSL